MTMIIDSEVCVCEVCGENILLGDRVVRIAADVAPEANVEATDSMVFAIFHSACIVSTFNEGECDFIPYVDEAREIIQASSLCDCCSDEIEIKDAPGLKLLRGGLS